MNDTIEEALKAFLAEDNPERAREMIRLQLPLTALYARHGTLLHCAAEAGNLVACRVIVSEAWRKYLSDALSRPVYFASPATLQKCLDEVPAQAVVILAQGLYADTYRITKEVSLASVDGDAQISGTIQVTEGHVHLHHIECLASFKAVWLGNHKRSAQADDDVFLDRQKITLANYALRGHVYKAVHDFIEQKNDQNDTAFMLAVKAFQPEIVEYFVASCDPDLNAFDASGLAPLHIAAQGSRSRKNAEAIAETLIANGAKVCLESRVNGMRPIHFAARAGALFILQLLLWHGASLNERDDDGNTPLHLACLAGETDMIRYCLKNTLIDFAKNNAGRTALHLATLHATPAIVKDLLDRGYDPNIQDVEGNTPLHLAANEGDIAIISLLLQDSRPDIRNHFEEKTAFHLAALKVAISDREAYLSLFSQFVAAGFSLEAKDVANKTPLDYASERLSTKIVLSALNEHLPVHEPSFIMTYPHETETLVSAFGFHIYDIGTKKLADTVTSRRTLDALADMRMALGMERYQGLCDEIIAWSKRKQDFLFFAAANGNEEWALKLLTDRSSVNAFDESGKMLLYYAIVNGMAKFAEKLLKFGSSVNTVDMLDQDGLTVVIASDRKIKHKADDVPVLLGEKDAPLVATFDERYAHIAKLLIKHGADPNRIVNGVTYLYQVLRLNDGQLFSTLVENGANPHLKDGKGRDLYEVIYSLNNPDPLILNVLREKRKVE